jgi:hypothetical protein
MRRITVPAKRSSLHNKPLPLPWKLSVKRRGQRLVLKLKLGKPKRTCERRWRCFLNQTMTS